MRNFWYSFLGALLALIVIPVLLFVFLIAGASASTLWKKPEVKPLKKDAVLYLKLDRPLPEKSKEMSFGSISLMGGDLEEMFAKRPLTLRKALKRLRQAAKDPHIKGVFLDLTAMNPIFYTPTEAVKLMEVRRVLDSMRAAGKPIIAYSEYVMAPQLYLGAAADSFFVHPVGISGIAGVKATFLYMRGLLDKLDVTPVELRIGKYKSAAETISRREMSEGQREQAQEMLDYFYRYLYLQPIKGRMPMAEADSLIRSGAWLFNVKALADAGVVDGLRTRDEVLALVDKWVDDDRPIEKKLVELYEYRGKEKSKHAKNKIAVLVAEGGIVMDGNPDEEISAMDIIPLIRKVREDDDVKALVLRVNSPGGDALASELIHRELELTRQKKPVVVSMSSLAASGGYYISCGADSIFAYPTTLTGSIGVIGLLLNPHRLIKEKLDINPYTLKIGKYADLGNMTRPLTDDEKRILLGFMRQIYGVFLQRVAEGRGLDTAYVNSIGGGRVWMGVRAQEKGLVDAIGYYDDAVAAAAQLAGVEKYKVVMVRRPKKKFFLSLLEGMDASAMMESVIPQPYRNAAKTLKHILPTSASPLSSVKLIMPWIILN